ncbi:uncharacterized protein LOC129608611 [Condylostylus longicornis]|uniref:uncharacterized protein LOC129608611 n=1 Tax=Condylostylus longicornis TaxID=2530218 RepID=UPI00244E4F2A|nr:uncharacterized protein LOC129608611 [Condylostylus longicornis]
MKQIADVDVHVEGYVRHKDNHKYYGRFNGTYSICRVLAFKNASPLAGLMFTHLKNFGNIPDDCPIKKDTYGLKKLGFGDHSAKLNLPEAEIDIHIQAFVLTGNEIVKVLDNSYKAEAIYKEVEGEGRRSAGLLSMLG